MELKFKAWDPIKEEFVYSEKIAGGMWRFFKELEDRGMRHFQARIFVGIQDWNNIDVYDGDLISPASSDIVQIIREVYFDKISCGFRLDAGNNERQFDKTKMIGYVSLGHIVGSADQKRYRI